jgi:hypothetical protein
MNSNNGFENLKNGNNRILLQDWVNDSMRSYKMTGCRHANGKDYWLIIQNIIADTPYNCIRAFPITHSGIGSPIKSYLPIPQLHPRWFMNMKASYDGKLLVSCLDSLVAFIDFDPASGKATNQRNYPFKKPGTSLWGFSEGIAFSPNDSLIYVTSRTSMNGVH